MDSAQIPEKLTAEVILEYQTRIGSYQRITASEYKAIGRELRDRFGLSDMEAINLLNGRDELKILARYE